ncbi:hypothetical protein ALC57_08480 [Trachymyrmex cornetzi]|uniref:Regulatory protein zeste n=1 Tax=Trachymyrmex cornetzi TaxID=471704 RepID=A0A151J6X6_9HYME|nr:hypothetical protein ALC57_08480 [Trachymyrmex cornetzi]
MTKHPELQSGKFSATFTYKNAQKLWEEVTAQLHQIPGAVKEWNKWRKTWQDMRSATKAKNTSIKKHAQGTGGGPASSQVLTEIDQNILTLIGPTVVEGHNSTQESNVQFVSNLIIKLNIRLKKILISFLFLLIYLHVAFMC